VPVGKARGGGAAVIVAFHEFLGLPESGRPEPPRSGVRSEPAAIPPSPRSRWCCRAAKCLFWRPGWGVEKTTFLQSPAPKNPEFPVAPSKLEGGRACFQVLPRGPAPPSPPEGEAPGRGPGF